MEWFDMNNDRLKENIQDTIDDLQKIAELLSAE